MSIPASRSPASGATSGEAGTTEKIRVLFVCTGNICRSPTAEGMFRALVIRAGLAHRIEAASAGTHGYHVGEPPDARTQAAARRRGLDLSGQRAQRVTAEHFHACDLLVAMDRSHLRALERLAPPRARGQAVLFLSYAPDTGLEDVPDPYYGGASGFDLVLDLVERGCAGLLDHLRRTRLGAG